MMGPQIGAIMPQTGYLCRETVRVLEGNSGLEAIVQATTASASLDPIKIKFF